MIQLLNSKTNFIIIRYIDYIFEKPINYRYANC